jgi:hypothetical protein
MNHDDERCDVCGARVARPGWCTRCQDQIRAETVEQTRR